jgi:hypothetical protein
MSDSFATYGSKSQWSRGLGVYSQYFILFVTYKLAQ